MVFTQAIASGFSNYVNFSGRSGRSEYWYWVLFNMLAYIGIFVIGLVLSLLFGEIFGIVTMVAYVGFALAALIPSFAVMIRRFHDLDKSGWWWLVNFIPFVGALAFLYFMVQPSDEEDNRFGSVPEPGVPA